MVNVKEKDYIVIVQCHIVKERCPGYFCEKAFNERTGGFPFTQRIKITAKLILPVEAVAEKPFIAN